MRVFVVLLVVGGMFLGCARGGDEARQRGSGLAGASAAAAPSASVQSVAAPASAAAAPLRLPLAGGRAVLVDGDDHVAVVEADGGTSAESWCGANGISYARASAFLREVTRLVQAHDKAALADLVKFPLHARVPVKNREDFVRKYERIFTPSDAAAIAGSDPGEVFCRNGAFMLGHGEIWAEPDANGAYRIITVNPALPHAPPRR